MILLTLLAQLAFGAGCPGPLFDLDVTEALPGERPRGEVPTFGPTPHFLVRWRGPRPPELAFVALDGTEVRAVRDRSWLWRRRPAAIVRPDTPLAPGVWTLQGRDRSRAKRAAIKRQGGDPAVGTRTAPAQIGERFRVEDQQAQAIELRAATGTWTWSDTRDLDEEPGMQLRIETDATGEGPVVWLIFRGDASRPVAVVPGDVDGARVARRNKCSLTPETPEAPIEIVGVDRAGRETRRVAVTPVGEG